MAFVRRLHYIVCVYHLSKIIKLHRMFQKKETAFLSTFMRDATHE